MNFKTPYVFLLPAVWLCSCKPVPPSTEKPGIPIQGTWKLLSSSTVENGKTTLTDFTKDQRMIKIINATHFSFLRHDVKVNKEGKNNFDAGGGRYTLRGEDYTEHLDYYGDPNWEGKTFHFKLKIHQDTLIQTGVEKVEEAGINRTITEKYLNIKSE